jgi:hypothetical protein
VAPLGQPQRGNESERSRADDGHATHESKRTILSAVSLDGRQTRKAT